MTTRTKYQPYKVISLPLEDHTILWFREINKYILTTPPADEILRRIAETEDLSSVVNFCITSLNMEHYQAREVTEDFKNTWEALKKETIASNTDPSETPEKLIPGKNSYSARYYKVFDKIFFIEYDSPDAESVVHPKFAHLEIPEKAQSAHHFRIGDTGSFYHLRVDGKEKGTWKKKERHLLAGKVSMEILQKTYRKEEKEWMGVFHAAGISDGKRCMMFLGNSGIGKSVLSALLMATGYEVLSDDFLPVMSKEALVCRFPAAISIKKEAYELLEPEFPEMIHSEEHTNPVLHKTFRYLPLASQKPLCVPCKGLIFMQYRKHSGFVFEEIPKQEAIKKLIPDSWISPEPDNAKHFLHWVASLPCYNLIYSDTEKMIHSLDNLFNKGYE
jgi:hypothetical protein